MIRSAVVTVVMVAFSAAVAIGTAGLASAGVTSGDDDEHGVKITEAEFDTGYKSMKRPPSARHTLTSCDAIAPPSRLAGLLY
jgi:hypothetical protein